VGVEVGWGWGVGVVTEHKMCVLIFNFGVKHFPFYEELSEIYAVHSPTNAIFINLVRSFKFTLKYAIISLLHVSLVNDHHQGALSVPN